MAPARPPWPAFLAASGLGVGCLPWAPGTWASLLALPAAWAMAAAGGPLALLAAAALVFALGLVATRACLQGRSDSDPSFIVIDEVAGQWLTLVAVPPDILAYVLGFLLFRLFDILKPWPVSWADRHVGGALGVMLDDVLAAAYAGAVLLAVTHMMGGIAGTGG